MPAPPNPLAGDITRIYTEVSSQPGRFLNDFSYLGFNQAENGKQVFDGMMQWIAAGDGISMNYRWSQPGRTERNRQDHLYRRRAFSRSRTCHDGPDHRQDGQPLCEMHGDQHVSVCHGDLFGQRVLGQGRVVYDDRSDRHTEICRISPFTRIYFMSSMQHGTGNGTSKGSCQQFRNPLDSSAVQRALFVALDQWSTNGNAAAAEQVPKLSDGTLVRAAAAERARASQTFPA